MPLLAEIGVELVGEPEIISPQHHSALERAA